MPERATATDEIQNRIEIHLLNEGQTAYGDCILCIFGGITVLIDGAHPGDDQASDRIKRSIPEQLATLLGQSEDSLQVDLLIVTHTHADHFGCLPELIHSERLKTEWAIVADAELGWGHGPGGETDATIDPRVRRIMEYFRDDTTEDLPLSDAAMVLSDARPPQEESYKTMVAELESSAKTVRYRDNQPPNGATKQKELVDHFAALGLEIDILGPSAEQLFLCAEGLAKSLQLVRDVAEDALSRHPLDSDAVDVLGSLLSDARNPSRAGNFVNLQSLVTVFRYSGRKFLFTGDMQLIDPTTQFSKVPVPQKIYDGIEELRRKIGAAAPFDLVKFGHHGSHNANNIELVEAMGNTALFGFSLGEFSPNHPSTEVIDGILTPLKQKIQWLRTDFNGLCSFFFDQNGVKYQMEKGRINDLRPNPGKRGTAPEDAVRVAGRAVPLIERRPQTTEGGSLQIDASIPFGAGEAHVSVSIVPPGATSASSKEVPAAPPTRPERNAVSPPGPPPEPRKDRAPVISEPPLNFAGGRQLDKLLFVTSQATLSKNIGEKEAALALAAIQGAGMSIISDLPERLTLKDFGATAQRVRAALAKDGAIRGVVLLGGLDVVPSRQIDTLPENLRHAVRPSDDRYDNFIVWCDDEYGARGTGDFVPVSRIPDGQYAPLVFSALSASKRDVAPKCRAIRNLLRPFATQMSADFPDHPGVFLVSGPVLYNNPPYFLAGQNAYIMLHGDFGNGREYVGETNDGKYTSAMRIDNVPAIAGHVAFAGCCWGALTTNVTASRAPAEVPVESRGHNGSIALRFLENGALSFVGCTGAHYPPQKGESVNTLGGAMHKAFWEAYFLSPEIGPAEALFRAKQLYLKEMPHGQDDPFRQAAEYKTYFQFTCLGLGW
jgi:beta-lactamase superfamily II metal-dependent hydrolase